MANVSSPERQRAATIYEILQGLYPQARCSLNYSSPLELLIATILSAQCTDERVNIVTASLFQKYRTVADYAQVSQEELEERIKSTGFFRNKARSIIGMAKTLMDKYDGDVPRTMEELVQLPGVGRKTANVVLGNAFNINIGFVVDTHIGRLAQRMALSRHKTPEKIEPDLMARFPREAWCQLSHLLIAHGRALCKAQRPNCAQCPLLSHCPAGPKFLKAAKGKKRSRKTQL